MARRNKETLPFDMFDHDRTDARAAAASKLERLYHKGQVKAWDGRDVLAVCIDRRGGVQLPPGGREPLRRLFAVILWGELAAWKISAKLAAQLVPVEAKLAATSQAHDEARHFYVMRDYLSLLGEVPKDLSPRSVRLIERIMSTDDLARMLLGMQLVIEPMALTLFHIVRKRRIEPVLADLLAFFERDEARHVALGVLYLPDVLAKMSALQLARLARWQLTTYLMQLRVLKEMRPDFEALGIDIRDVLELGRKKQVLATGMLAEQVGRNLPVTEAFLRIIDFKSEMDFGEPQGGRARRVLRAVDKLVRGPGDEWAGRHAGHGPKPVVDTSTLTDA